MMTWTRIVRTLVVATIAASALAGPRQAAGDVDADVQAALKNLYATEPVAKMIGDKAKAILVFPNIVKAGFVVGGQFGDGALLKDFDARCLSSYIQ